MSIRHLAIEGDFRGHGQLDLRAGAVTTPDRKPGADLFRTFSHSGDAPVPVRPRARDLRIDSGAIVSDVQAQSVRRVIELEVDGPRSGVAKRVQQRFATIL